MLATVVLGSDQFKGWVQTSRDEMGFVKSGSLPTLTWVAAPHSRHPPSEGSVFKNFPFENGLFRDLRSKATGGVTGGVMQNYPPNPTPGANFRREGQVDALF